jgi:hypothetical protein
MVAVTPLLFFPPDCTENNHPIGTRLLTCVAQIYNYGYQSVEKSVSHAHPLPSVSGVGKT